MAEAFSRMPGEFIELANTIEGFGQPLESAGDNYPEASFYMTSDIKTAFEEGREIERRAAISLLLIRKEN